MTIFINNLKRIFRRKSNLLTMVIFPIVLIAFTIGLNSGTSKLTLGIVDNDNTKLTKILKENLNSKAKIKNLNESQIKSSLIDSKAEYVIVIPKGFTDNTIQGKEVKIKGYEITGTNASYSIKMNINSFINAAKTISKASNGNGTVFYNGIDKYNNKIIDVNYKSTDKNSVSKKNVSFSLGFLIYGMFLFASNLTPLILKDKKTKVYNRIFAGPISPKNYTLQNIISFLAVLALQVVLIFTFMIYVCHIKFPSLINMLFLFMIISVFVISFALFIVNNSKDLKSASALSTLIVTPMAMLGGLFWPLDIMPQLLKNISKFIPVFWMKSAADKLLYEKSLYDILPEISVLLLFTAVFLLLASWRKKDILE